jgi:hypothetical protein
MQMSDDFRGLAKLVLQRLGLEQSYDFMEQEVKYELEGDYGEEDEWYGTITDCVEVFDDNGKAIGVFSKFTAKQLEFFRAVCPEEAVHVEWEKGVMRFLINIRLPVLPAVPNGDTMDLEISFQGMRGKRGEVEILPETRTSSDEKTVAMSRLAYAMA